MIKLFLILAAGLGIGYTYGYLQGAAGDDDLVAVGLGKVGVHRVVNEAERSVAEARREERRRQASIDSIKQARIDSVSSLIHH
jgi:hypothetical protein